MNLPVMGDAHSLPALARWVSTLASSVAAGWNVQHRPDGTHRFPWVHEPWPSVVVTNLTLSTRTILKYVLVGSTMTVAFDMTGTSGTANTISFPIPGGYSAKDTTSAGTYAYSDAGTAGIGDPIVTGRRVDLYKSLSAPAWTAGTTRVQGTITFEVA